MDIRYCFIFIFVLFFSCGGTGEPKQAVIVKSKVKKDEGFLVKENRYIVEDENIQIDNLVKRYGWVMKSDGTGLRFMIYENGNGRKAEAGKYVVVKYDLRLIDGKLVDSSQKNGNLRFILHHSDKVNGLEAGVLKMREGDKAKLIVPSYLAYGLSGLEDKVPMRSTLVFDVELLEVSD